MMREMGCHGVSASRPPERPIEKSFGRPIKRLPPLSRIVDLPQNKTAGSVEGCPTHVLTELKLLALNSRSVVTRSNIRSSQPTRSLVYLKQECQKLSRQWRLASANPQGKDGSNQIDRA